MVRIRRVSSYTGFELSGLNCIENSTPNPRGMEMEIWFELAGVLVIQVSVTEVILYVNLRFFYRI